LTDPCGPCGLCCRSYLVPVFGHDVWRIASDLGLAPERFLFVAEQVEPDALGFRLDASDTTHGLALLKTEPITATQPCIFLEPDGANTRCGIYAQRPITCRAYPMAKLGDTVYQRATTLCPPDAWADADLAARHWRTTLQTLRMYRDIYVEAVARWNGAIARWQPPAPIPASVYSGYLLTVYRAIDELERSIGAAGLEPIIDQWAQLPPRTAEADDIGDRATEPGWIGHFRAVRALIDRTFPELPPLPFQRLVIETESRSG
jgi:Fe-S-cluster containining protein